MPLIAHDRESEGVRSFVREISGLEADMDEVRAAIRVNSAAYASLTNPAPIDLDAIQRTILDDRTALYRVRLG